MIALRELVCSLVGFLCVEPATPSLSAEPAAGVPTWHVIETFWTPPIKEGGSKCALALTQTLELGLQQGLSFEARLVADGSKIAGWRLGPMEEDPQVARELRSSIAITLAACSVPPQEVTPNSALPQVAHWLLTFLQSGSITTLAAHVPDGIACFGPGDKPPANCPRAQDASLRKPRVGPLMRRR